ncbi:hypothetical protein SAMN05421770_10389 [Granulicella rosea]|uniref:Uncharacterized protein n=1 Tax=Granulicella rosea TaxID=474952 RepID=A0A239IG13_9BACT|nr:hypothetical protein SAMN05421770_10389 [Granulicella rosea]
MRKLHPIFAAAGAAFLCPPGAIFLFIWAENSVPIWLRCLISPGYYPGLWFPGHPNHWDFLYVPPVALAIDMVYCGVLLYLVLRQVLRVPRRWDRTRTAKARLSSHDAFWTQY